MRTAPKSIVLIRIITDRAHPTLLELFLSFCSDSARTVTHGYMNMSQAADAKASNFMRLSADFRNRPNWRPASASATASSRSTSPRVSPFGKGHRSTRPEAVSACVARGGPDGGMVSSATNQYLILNEMAAAANAVQLEAARQQEAARVYAIHAGAAGRLSVQQHIEAQQAAVAAAADSHHGHHSPGPPTARPAAPSPVLDPSSKGITQRNDSYENSPPSRGATVCLGAASSSRSRSPGPTGGWSPGGWSPSERSDGSPMRTASPTLAKHSYPGSPSGGGIRASQLMSAPKTVVQYQGSATLRRSFDIAMLASSRAREECVCTVQEVMQELSGHVWPNQEAGLAARALVVRLSRSAARLRAATERLEKEFDVAHHAHQAELDSASHHYSYTLADLVCQRDVMERSMAAELTLCEREHEEHASSLRTGGMNEAMELQKQLDASKVQHRWATARMEEDLVRQKRVNAEAAIKIGELDQQGSQAREEAARLEGTKLQHSRAAARLEENLIREKRENTEAAIKIGELDKMISHLREENARLEGLWKAEVQDLREKAKSDASRTRDVHEREIAQLEAAFQCVVNEKQAVEQKYKSTQRDLEATTQKMEASDAANHQRVEEAIVAGQAEAARLQREVDKGKALPKAALAAGYYKGRQMLYLDSLKSPAPRANTPEAQRHDGSLSWRAWSESEVYRLTRATVGQAAFDRMRVLDDENNDAPSSFQEEYETQRPRIAR